MSFCQLFAHAEVGLACETSALLQVAYNEDVQFDLVVMLQFLPTHQMKPNGYKPRLFYTTYTSAFLFSLFYTFVFSCTSI